MDNERRRVPRYAAHLKGTLALAETGSIAVVVEDLSVLGCLVESAPPLQVREEGVLSLEWSGREFQTAATGIWKGPQGQAGLSFHDTDESSQELLRRICGELRMKPLIRRPESIR